MSDKGLFGSICGFFKGLFSSGQPASTSTAAATPAAAPKTNDGLTGVERYIRNKAQQETHLTGVEKYIRNQAATTKTVTSVEQYIQNKANAKAITGVEKYIRSKG
jgi:hypothetical protein